MLDVVCAQLKEDISNMNSGKSISLLAKWIPSINASSPVSRRYAKLICGYIGIQEWDYRKAVSALRTKLDIVEKKMSTKALSCATTRIAAASSSVVWKRERPRLTPLPSSRTTL